MKKNCKDCNKIMKGFKPWDDKEYTEGDVVTNATCKKCGTSFEIYKNMINVLPRRKINDMAWNTGRKLGGNKK